MAVNDRDQIRELMNIESFAQLPFIRPAPPVRGKSIRLFGKEFKGSRENSTTEENSSEREEIVKDSAGNNETDMIGITSNSNRRFECPYCCRNFHTSQALGGHQNAHKRERQQEKRAHMQAMEAQYGGLVDARVYNGAVQAVIPLANSYYHSWNNMIISGNASHSCFCNGCTAAHHHHHQPQPINGSPLTAALWRRVPSAESSSAFESERSMMYHRPRSLEPKDELKQFSLMNSDHQRRRLGYNLSKPAGMKDQVSLDLRL